MVILESRAEVQSDDTPWGARVTGWRLGDLSRGLPSPLQERSRTNYNVLAPRVALITEDATHLAYRPAGQAMLLGRG